MHQQTFSEITVGHYRKPLDTDSGGQWRHVLQSDIIPPHGQHVVLWRTDGVRARTQDLPSFFALGLYY